jgi:hypothetical protein
LQEEVRKNKGKKADDPFTRRSTKPRMVFKVHDQENVDEGNLMSAAEVNARGDISDYILMFYCATNTDATCFDPVGLDVMVYTINLKVLLLSMFLINQK